MAIKYVVVCVRDSAADSWGVPIFVPSAGQAVRSFSDEINRIDANNPMFNHPGDFTLHELGTFDDQTGEFECIPARQLVRGADVAKAAMTVGKK